MGNANRKWTQQTNRQRRLKMRSAGTQRHMLHSSLLALLSVRTNAPIAGGSHHGIGPPVTVRQPNTIPTFRGAFPTFDIMSWVPPSGSFDPQSESWGGRGVPTHVVASAAAGPPTAPPTAPLPPPLPFWYGCPDPSQAALRHAPQHRDPYSALARTPPRPRRAERSRRRRCPPLSASAQSVPTLTRRPSRWVLGGRGCS